MRIPPDPIVRPVFIGSLVAWSVLVVASGAFAALAFPAVRDLAPVVPSMPVMTEFHWKVVAGVPAQRNFEVVQAAGWGLAACSILLSLACRGKPGFVAGVQWTAHLVAAGMLAVLQVVVMNPLGSLGVDLHEAMRRGDLDASMALDREFASIHALATPMMTAMLVAIATVMVAALIRTPRSSSDAGSQAP